MIKVEGPEDPRLFTGQEVNEVYLGDKAAPTGEAIKKATVAEREGQLSLAQQVEAGKVLYQGTCSVCHGGQGEGMPGVFPPLAKADYLMEDKERSIGIVLNGLEGPVVVNGETFNSVMPPMSQLSDDEVANILTYVRNAFGNQGEAVTSAEVRHIRATTERPPGAAH